MSADVTATAKRKYARCQRLTAELSAHGAGREGGTCRNWHAPFAVLRTTSTCPVMTP
jgi:hypothetical protein